jgi:hypothetical protein
MERGACSRGGGDRVIVSKNGSKACKSSIERLGVDRKSKVSGAIPREVEITLRV